LFKIEDTNAARNSCSCDCRKRLIKKKCAPHSCKMSNLEGKNCFRVKSSQSAVYSGGNIATVWIPRTQPSVDGEGDEEEGLVLACGDTVHVVRSSTGVSVASFTCPSDDIVLHLDAVVVVPQPQQHPARPEQAVPAGAYIAFSTRALQIYVLSLRARTIEELQDATTTSKLEGSVDTGGDEGNSAYVLTTVHSWTAGLQAVSIVRLTTGGHYLLTGSTDGAVRSWNVFHHFLTHNLRCAGNSMVSSLHVDDEEPAVGAALTLLAVGSFEGHVSLFDFASKSLLASKRPHASAVEAIAFANAGSARSIVTVGRDRKICILSASDLTEQRCVVILEHVSCAVFYSPHVLHVGSLDGIVASYSINETETPAVCNICRLQKRSSANLQDGDEEMQIRSLVAAGRPRSNVSSTAAWIEDTKRSLIQKDADEDRTLKKTKNKQRQQKEQKDEAPSSSNADVVSLTKQFADRHVFAADASFSILRLRADTCAPTQYRIEDSTVGSLDQVLDVKLMPLSRCGAPNLFSRFVVSNSKDVRYFAGDGRVATATLSGHMDIVMACALSPTADILATGGKDNNVRFWSVDSPNPREWRCIAVGEGGHTNAISALCFTTKPNETFLACFSVGQDDCLRMWDIAHLLAPRLGTEPESLQHRTGINNAHDGSIFCVAVSPNDQFIATGGKDHAVNVWRLQGKKLFKEATMKGHKRAVTAVAFSPADRVMASSGNDGSIRLWSLVSFAIVKALQHDKIAVLTVHFFNAGTQLVTSNADGVIRVWATAASEVVATIDVHNEKVWTLAVRETSDGATYFMSGAADGVLAVTEDYTAEEAARIQKDRRDTILNEQSLANAMRRGEFSAAFVLALSLNHPRHLRQVVAKWMAKDEAECKLTITQEILPSLSQDQLRTLLEFARDWIVNARHCAVATIVVEGIVDGFHFVTLAAMQSFRPMLETLYGYLTRHANRIRHVIDRSYYVDLVTAGHGSCARGLTIRRNVALDPTGPTVLAEEPITAPASSAAVAAEGATGTARPREDEPTARESNKKRRGEPGPRKVK
jgi:U3 small nucleolar RNA-associated protein 13